MNMCFSGLGFRDIRTRMENRMETYMDNEMEAGICGACGVDAKNPA